MFLTRKAIKKVRTFAIVFLILGGIFLTLALLYAWMGEPFLWLLFLGIGCFPFSFVVYKTGLYAEGVSTVANLLRKGIRLVYVTLQPAEFVRMYQETATSPENVRVKPDLQLLLTLF